MTTVVSNKPNSQQPGQSRLPGNKDYQKQPVGDQEKDNIIKPHEQNYKMYSQDSKLQTERGISPKLVKDMSNSKIMDSIRGNTDTDMTAYSSQVTVDGYKSKETRTASEKQQKQGKVCEKKTFWIFFQ